MARRPLGPNSTPAAEFFANASNILIHRDNYNVIAGNVVQNQSYNGFERKGFDLLQAFCSLEALVDSNERYDPPKCSPETRDLLIKDIVDWVDSDSPHASMLWLHGSAGAGKSALMQSIAELYKQQGRLLASFFFSRAAASSERSDGNRLIPTLAYQLVQEIPKLRPVVEAYIEKDPGIFQRRRDVQMWHLFSFPLLPPPSPKPRVRPGFVSFMKYLLRQSPPPTKFPPFFGDNRLVVIDGLDECQDPEVQRDLLEIIGSTVSYLQLPVRFLVASRPEPQIRRTLEHNVAFKTIPLRRLDLDEDPGAWTGIRRLLIQEFKKIRETHPLGPHIDPSWPSEAVIDDLTTKSFPQFIYATTVINYVKSPRHRPDDRLQVILRILAIPVKDRPLAQLDILYAFIFSSIDEDHREKVWLVLGLLCLAGKGEVQLVMTPSVIEEVLQYRLGDIQLLLDPLASVISCPTERHGSIIVLHATLFDYLLDQARSEVFFLDLRPAYNALAKHFHRASLTGPKFLTIENILVEPFVQCLRYSRRADLSELDQHEILFQSCEKVLGLPKGDKAMDINRWLAWVIFFVHDVVNVALREDFFGKNQPLLLENLEIVYKNVVMQARSMYEARYAGDGFAAAVIDAHVNAHHIDRQSSILDNTGRIYSFLLMLVQLGDSEETPGSDLVRMILRLQAPLPPSRLLKHLCIVLTDDDAPVVTFSSEWVLQVAKAFHLFPQEHNNSDFEREIDTRYQHVQKIRGQRMSL